MTGQKSDGFGSRGRVGPSVDALDHIPDRGVSRWSRWRKSGLDRGLFASAFDSDQANRNVIAVFPAAEVGVGGLLAFDDGPPERAWPGPAPRCLVEIPEIHRVGVLHRRRALANLANWSS
jgi:hypothetical protein